MEEKEEKVETEETPRPNTFCKEAEEEQVGKREVESR